MNISVFISATNAHTQKTYDILDVLNWIKSGKSKSFIEQVRQKQSALMELEKGSEQHKKIETEKTELKRRLESIVFQGVFSYRAKNGLTEHSELATLDFDHVSDPNFIRDFIFDSYKFVYSAFISPSGDGVKVLVRIPKVKNDEEYKQYYTVLLNYFDSATSDQATKDISRICFISYDPDLRLRE